MSSCDASPAPTQQTKISGARTTIVTLMAPRRTVFDFLADIENLPRWAGGFCEALELGRNHWTALTSLGELFLELEGDSEAGKITLLVGWERDALWELALMLANSSEGGTRVKFALDAAAGERQAELYLALEPEIRGLVTQFGGRVPRSELAW